MVLYHRFTRDDELGYIIHYGLFKTIEEMIEAQKKEYEAMVKEDEDWHIANNREYIPEDIFVGVEIIDSKEYKGEKEIVTVCKEYETGEYNYISQYLFTEVNTKKLKDGGENVSCVYTEANL